MAYVIQVTSGKHAGAWLRGILPTGMDFTTHEQEAMKFDTDDQALRRWVTATKDYGWSCNIKFLQEKST
jgi:hypothetical protein